MKISRVILVSVSVLITTASPSSAETVQPALRNALVSSSINQEFDVIVSFKSEVDLSTLPALDRSGRLATILGALKRTADLDQLEARRLLLTYGRQFKNIWIVNALAARVPGWLVNRLAVDPRVESVRLDQTVTLAAAPSAGGSARGWNIGRIGVPELEAQGIRGEGTVVATMDTGVDASHAYLAGNWRGGNNSWFDAFGALTAPADPHGHGTQTMGVLVADVGGGPSATQLGVAPAARWIAARVFDANLESNFSTIHLGYQWMLDPDGNPATDDAPDVVSNSWSILGTTNQCLSEFDEDLHVLKLAGIGVVFSAGNGGPETATSESPGNSSDSIAVGATDDGDAVADFSARGPGACDGRAFPDVVAPGVAVTTATSTLGLPGIPADVEAVVDGTSVAAPHVAGAMALLMGAFPEATVGGIEAAIKNTALDLGANGPDDDYGHGLLDVAAAHACLEDPLDITRALYRTPTLATNPDRLVVWAPSCLADAADLTVKAYLADGNQRVWSLNWNAGKDRWNRVVGNFEANEGSVPVTVLVSGPEGEQAALLRYVGASPSYPEPVDADGDEYGFAGGLVDCNDSDPAIHPDATEQSSDGIDQDCNGYDLTIDITRAWYFEQDDRMVAWATSDLGEQAGLSVTIVNADGTTVDRSMTWNATKNRWQRGIADYTVKFGSPPLAITVSGPEGSQARSIELR